MDAADPPGGSIAPPRPAGRLRRAGLVVAANLLVLGALLAAVEGFGRVAVWWGDVPAGYRPRPFHQFGQTDPVLWWTLRPSSDIDFLGVRTRINSLGFRDRRETLPPGSLKVYALGDSTTFGWRVPDAAMYTARAETALRDRLGGPVSVVSTGVPGYDSYQCETLLRARVLGLRPDAIVLMASNNELRARTIGDRDRGRALERKERIDRVLGWSHFWRWLSNRDGGPATRGWDENPPPGRPANTVAEYVRNVRETVELARRAGCRVVVMNMPLRLRYEPTWTLHDRPDEASKRLLRRFERASRAGEPIERRRSILRELIAHQPALSRPHLELAWVELERGDLAESDRQFALARDFDLHPEASKPEYNHALETACRGLSVPFVDVDERFRRSGRGESELFLDHCHPSPAGHAIIAEALAESLTGELRPPARKD